MKILSGYYFDIGAKSMDHLKGILIGMQHYVREED